MHFQSRVATCCVLVFLSFLLLILALCAGTKPNFLPDASLVNRAFIPWVAGIAFVGLDLLSQLFWTAVGALFVGLVVHSFEYGLQKLTPSGGVIAAKHKSDKTPWVSYNP
ncbi:hypothetical protein BGZ57DRAFT_862154 [Hyaloscypha finlandica]|nr:hypothetical protein BGZ57DRAFT_862154 [Hyaloscypha finlandica]